MALFGFFVRIVSVFLMSSYIVVSTFAAGTIPRSDLRLELMLATGAQDTSGNGRPVTATGLAPTYQVDSTYGVPFAQFSGSGGLKVNTAWNSTTSDDFTASIWLRHSGIFLVPATTFTGETIDTITYPQLPGFYRNMYFTNLEQNIFQTSGDFKLVVNNQGKCAIRGPKTEIMTNSVQVFSRYLPSVNVTTWGYDQTMLTLDSDNNMQESFSCNQILDGKWHNIILARKASVFSFYIDGSEITKLSSASFAIGRSLIIGSSQNDVTSTYSGKFLPQKIDTIVKSKYLRAGIAGFRLYSRALSDDEREALLDEYRYAQSDLAGAGNVTIGMEKYSKPNLIINIKNIAPNLSKNLVDYQYAVSGSTFAPVSDITDTSTNTGSLQYRISLNLSDVRDGRVSVSFRIKSGTSYQNIGTVSFSKIDTLANITINQPSADITTSKTITATTDTTALLYMYQTRGTVCDSTITTWEDYSDLTFTNNSDNGTRICYKAVYNDTGKTIYKISATINGIQPDTDAKNVTSVSVFKDYLLWQKSNFIKPNDSTSMILDLLGVNSTSSTPGQPSSYNGAVNGVTMTDINGDGLVDFLYSINSPNFRKAIIVNNGNYTFKTAYKCAIDGGVVVNGLPPTPYIYYGDCADTSR